MKKQRKLEETQVSEVIWCPTCQECCIFYNNRCYKCGNTYKPIVSVWEVDMGSGQDFMTRLKEKEKDKKLKEQYKMADYFAEKIAEHIKNLFYEFIESKED